jgi:hypothetical protein
MHAGHEPSSVETLLEDDETTMKISNTDETISVQPSIDKRDRSEEWKEIERSTRKKKKKGQDSAAASVQRSIAENFRSVGQLDLLVKAWPHLQAGGTICLSHKRFEWISISLNGAVITDTTHPSLPLICSSLVTVNNLSLRIFSTAL